MEWNPVLMTTERRIAIINLRFCFVFVGQVSPFVPLDCCAGSSRSGHRLQSPARPETFERIWSRNRCQPSSRPTSTTGEKKLKETFATRQPTHLILISILVPMELIAATYWDVPSTARCCDRINNSSVRNRVSKRSFTWAWKQNRKREFMKRFQRKNITQRVYHSASAIMMKNSSVLVAPRHLMSLSRAIMLSALRSTRLSLFQFFRETAIDRFACWNIEKSLPMAIVVSDAKTESEGRRDNWTLALTYWGTEHYAIQRPSITDRRQCPLSLFLRSSGRLKPRHDLRASD